jgi:chemotaxis signal transduction protein
MNIHVKARAADLRREFDQGFAAAVAAALRNEVNLLAISLAEMPYALNLADIGSVYANKKITPIPAKAPGLLGIAGFRGVILPVYDLSVMLGLPRIERPRWFAVVAKADLVVAFETFDGYLRVPAQDVIANDAREGGREHVSHLLKSADGIRAVIDLSFARLSTTRHDSN